MMILGILFFLIFGHQDDGYSSFNQLLKIGTAGEYTFAVQNGNEYMLTIMDDELNKIKEFVRKGNGPGELTQVDAATYSSETNLFYMIGKSRLLAMEIEGNIAFEKQLPFMNSNDVAYYNGKLFIGMLSFVFTENLDKIHALSVLNLESGEITNHYIPYSDLNIASDSEIQKVRALNFKTSVTILKSTPYFTINGHPVIYAFKDNEIQKAYVSDKFESKFQTTYSSRFNQYGFSTPGIFNSIDNNSEYLVVTSGSQSYEQSLYFYDPLNESYYMHKDINSNKFESCIQSNFVNGVYFFYGCSYQLSFDYFIYDPNSNYSER